jgi:isopenicillin N synthase-like dioxygenase
METAMHAKRAKELETEGRLYVTYDPSLRAGVEEAMKAWKQFTQLPEAKKVLFGYSPDAKTSGNGYELKLEGAIDRKENVHLRVNARDELLNGAAQADPVIGPAFVESALALNELMASMVRDFARTIEEECAIPGFELDVMDWQPKWLLRFLHYFGDRMPGEEIAAPHTDKGGFTLHLYESHPGVEYLTYDSREWKALPLSHDQTVIIPGMGLQNRSKGTLRALVHRVVATEETAETGRFSAVCFFNFNHARFFDKSRFGAQQAWAPGAFYDMPFEQFDSYFID